MTRPAALALLAMPGLAAAAPPGPPDPHFLVDQFGYRPREAKVAVVSEPVTGFNAPDPFTPSGTLEVRRWADDSVAFAAPAQAFAGGAVHAQSGDRAWWLDFSALEEAGSFYVWDPGRGAGSGRFEIGDGVYREALRHALRSFYYQRCGREREAAHAGPAWTDGACHVAPGQDREARSVLDASPATARDLAGGWHDAGDYNKYLNYADDPVHDLLRAWAESPLAFGDDLGIPESGNCVPDVLDEVRVELDWIRRMQEPDGSVLHKLSVTDWSAASPPSADASVRRYAPATASATISAAGALAHGAVVLGATGDPELEAEALLLEQAALRAWDWLEANPGRVPSAYDNAGFVNAAAEDGAYEQEANRLCAAVQLWRRTGDPRFRGVVDAGYRAVHLLEWGYAYPFEGGYQDCLLDYARAPGATAAVAAEIAAAYAASMRDDNLVHHRAREDAYRAFLGDGDWTWGSSRTKAVLGSMYQRVVADGLAPGEEREHREAAGGYLHYLHGVNPLGLVYLSNMGAHGAERSVTEFYHAWFADGTDWDSAVSSRFGPPPGYVPGGPNPRYRPDPAYTGPPLEPPQNQPIQKSYRDWNTSWPENSWEVTENAIGYQGAYVRLLAAFAGPAAAASGPASPGNALRGARRGGAVELSWTPAAGATSYNVLRCDAGAGACAPAAHAGATGTSFTDPAPLPPALWYELEAANACGTAR